MTLLLAIHVAGGIVALPAGFGALLARKGSAVHRAAGYLFVAAMVVMAAGATALAAAERQAGNVLAAVFVLYLVGTAVTTFLPASPRVARLDAAMRIAALPLAAAFVVAGVARLTIATESQGGVPARSIAVASFVNAMVMILGWHGDVRVSRRGMLVGPARVRRHLWRMCFAMFVASGSFFLGQPESVPEPLRVPPVPTLLALLPLLLMGPYLWRYRDRARRAARPGAAGIRVPDRALPAADAHADLTMRGVR